MIPQEVATLADLIFPDWAESDDLTLNEVLEAAWRIHNAGFRLPVKNPDQQSDGGSH